MRGHRKASNAFSFAMLLALLAIVSMPLRASADVIDGGADLVGRANLGESGILLSVAGDDGLIASGISGTCQWSIDGEGTLVVKPQSGDEGTLGDWSDSSSPWANYSSRIKAVRFYGTVHAITCRGMFGGCDLLASVDLSGLDTSSVTDMSGMFGFCRSLISFDASCLDTSSVTDMSNMFNMYGGGDPSLASLDLSSWDTSSVANVSWMFAGCSNLDSVDVSGWVTSSMVDTTHMFYYCRSLSILDVSTWDTSSVTSMSEMFGTCGSLTSLNVSGWDTSSVTDMSGMFSSCLSLASVDVSGWDTSSVTDMSGMFHSCVSLTSVNVSDWDTSSVTDMSYTFYYCSSLAFVDASKWDTSSVVDMSEMFGSCSMLSSLDVASWNTSSVTSMAGMFYRCGKLLSLDTSDWNTSSTEHMVGMFDGCSSLANLDVSGWDTSSVKNMESMFRGCASLSCPVVSHWDVSSVERLTSMFYGCSSLATLDLSLWDVSSAWDLSYMFYGCAALPALDLSAWDTSSVIDMGSTFYGCAGLVSLSLLQWDTSRVARMTDMFYGCTGLEMITIGEGFDADKAFPLPKGGGLWWSSTARSWFTVSEIMHSRSHVRDTYRMTKTGSVFIDVDPTDEGNHGFEVDWMGRVGISTGWETGDGLAFRGLWDVTRCDFAAFLYRMADLLDDGRRNDSIALPPAEVGRVLGGVSDCDAAKTHHAMEIAWMIKSGISRGWQDRGRATVSFRPYAKIARQDMAAFLYRFADIRDDGQQNRSLAMGPERVTFSDVRHGDEANHAPDVEWLASVGVTKGFKSGSRYQFRGTKTVARQDMAAFMYRLYTYLQGQ